MNILFINKFLHPNGGSETYIIKLGEYLSNQGHNVQYFGMEHKGRCLGNHANAYTADMDFHTGSILKKVSYPLRTIYSSKARKKLRIVLEDMKPDVCHLNNFNYQLTPSIILEIAKWRKQIGHICRIVFTAHDYQLLCPNHMFYNPVTHNTCENCGNGSFYHCLSGKCIHGSRMKSFIGMMEAYIWNASKVYSIIDSIICCSEFMKSKMDRNPSFRNKTVALHNFVDSVEQVNVCSRGDYVLYLGRYIEEKGIATLIEACKRLPNVPFVFAGSGSLAGEIRKVKNITDVGFKAGKELETVIRGARFTVCPSEWYENCPFSVMESQQYGKPVVGARIGGIPELVIDGINGLLFESANTDELVLSIKQLWENTKLIDTLSKQCLRQDRVSVDTYCQKLMPLYRGEVNV